MNLCNASTESEQFEEITQLVNVVLARDFSFFNNTKLEVIGESPAIKKKSVAKLMNKGGPSSKRYKFRQKHFSGLQ